MIGAVLAPVLDSGLDTPFGCVDGLRGLVGVSRGNLQTSRVELLLMFLHPGLLDLTELRIADRRTQRGEGGRAAVVRRGSTAEQIGSFSSPVTGYFHHGLLTSVVSYSPSTSPARRGRWCSRNTDRFRTFGHGLWILVHESLAEWNLPPSLNVSPKLVVIVQHENRARGRLATAFPDSPLKIAYG